MIQNCWLTEDKIDEWADFICQFAISSLLEAPIYRIKEIPPVKSG
jgi:hypothetical protein